jgi:carbon monoxide dehydrogenase subunit G
MQLLLEGSRTINLPREKVFDMLTDSRFIASSLPDAEEVNVVDKDTIDARLKVRIALVSASMKVRIRIGEREKPSFGTLYVEGSGSGSNVKITSRFELSNGQTTLMKWKATVDVTGVMAGLGSTILKSFADKKVTEIFNSITDAMEKAS